MENYSDEPVTRRVRNVMQGNRSRDTKPELLLRRSLWRAGLRGYRIHRKDLPGKPDIVYGSAKVAVFLHGCFWHGCERCDRSRSKTRTEFWSQKVARNRERDARNIEALVAQGYVVVVLWECDLKADPQQCVRLVDDAITRR